MTLMSCSSFDCSTFQPSVRLFTLKLICIQSFNLLGYAIKQPLQKICFNPIASSCKRFSQKTFAENKLYPSLICLSHRTNAYLSFLQKTPVKPSDPILLGFPFSVGQITLVSCIIRITNSFLLAFQLAIHINSLAHNTKGIPLKKIEEN